MIFRVTIHDRYIHESYPIRVSARDKQGAREFVENGCLAMGEEIEEIEETGEPDPDCD